jgi:hypothetical protein
MIEQIVLEYLSEQISVPVLMELPEVPSEGFPSMPERFLVLEKVGGGMTDHIGAGSIAVQSYSLNSLYEAAQLDEEVREVMWGIIERDDISEVRLSSNYNHTDTRTKRYRYQSVFEFHF